MSTYRYRLMWNRLITRSTGEVVISFRLLIPFTKKPFLILLCNRAGGHKFNYVYVSSPPTVNIIFILYRDSSKMEDAKLIKHSLTDSIGCCPGTEAQRQMLENVTSIMHPLTIKTEQMKRACNTCVTASPKKVKLWLFKYKITPSVWP